ncbi:Cyclin [Macleaya cordata]|uniref:Cyclin n=1 Tax=Macleaya cordata TaxID=56857 RepID=A0A200QAM4_MACCD|nr:Cyclin [Macleaya cordata]
MVDFDHDSSISFSLLCQETQASLDEELENEEPFFNLNYYYTSSENEDEHIEMLIERESRSNGFPENGFTITENWLKSARLDAIRWILKKRAYFGFGFQTAYLSMTYLDRFLSKRITDSEKYWAIHLLSVACLSLAAKMEECRAPALSEYHREEYNFDSKVIQKMELMVLSTLEWRMGSITPFAYLHYFISNFSNESRPQDLVSRSIELVFALIKEINLIDHPPSIIAAAAVFAALDQRLTRKTMGFKISSISSCRPLDNDHVFSCYNLMKKLQKETYKMTKFVNSPNITSTYSSSIDVLEDSSFTSAFKTRKRKLTFSDCDRRRRYPMRSGSSEENT